MFQNIAANQHHLSISNHRKSGKVQMVPDIKKCHAIGYRLLLKDEPCSLNFYLDAMHDIVRHLRI